MSPTPAGSADRHVDTLIVGNGPSALILSFILHGNLPYYDLDHPHPDPILHKKLSQSPCLLKLDVHDLTAHFEGSRISYSTQALPVNVLLDTLLRPLADVAPGEHPPSLVWRNEPDRAVKHIVIGETTETGGQWASNPVDASWDIGALSYLEQLSLPQYTLYDHLNKSQQSLASLTCERPTRRQIASYLAAYPSAIGINDSFRTGTVQNISRTEAGFHVASHGISCKHLVLASGIFSTLIPPPPKLQRILELRPEDQDAMGPLLVVGSGFSAADVIISNVEKRRIIHCFRWQPDERPSPLQACHPQAYPDYARVYRQMKEAAKKRFLEDDPFSPTSRKQKQFFDESVWHRNYIGLPNAEVEDVKLNSDRAIACFKCPDRSLISHEVTSLAYVIGRRGSLDFLSPALRREVIENSEFNEKATGLQDIDVLISGRTLRDKVERNVEVATNVFAVGSLTGDSLIRFAHGGCVESAGRILGDSTSPKSEKAVSWRESKSKEDVVVGTILPVNGGHEDLGRDPTLIPIPPSRSRFRWARRKSSCAVS